jgi:hypothetical protein
MTRRASLASALLLAASCAPSEDPGPTGDPRLEHTDDGCPVIFTQDQLVDYHVTIAPAEWAAIQDEFRTRPERLAAGLDPTPYHPIGLRHDGRDIPDAMIRLKGNTSWDQALAFDDDPKLQFVISFNEIDKGGRFFGVRKIELDMPRTDHSYLRQRLALSVLRDTGVPAQCANHARLHINGDYYGLYTHLERLDKEFLQRHYPNAADGDLWKAGREIKTNEDTFSWARLDTFWKIEEDLTALEAIADLEESVREWAAEALMPHADGYYMGRPNFYLYDHPLRGFVWLPHDLDTAFDYVPPDTTPLFPREGGGHTQNDRQHYIIVMNDTGWQDFYVDRLAEHHAGYLPEAIAARVDIWSEQLADAVDRDPRRPFSIGEHVVALDSLRSYPDARAGFLADWITCRSEGGADEDGDGVDYCYDCDDRNAAVKPGATEVCNGIDDDCDGLIDETDGGPECPPS